MGRDFVLACGRAQLVAKLLPLRPEFIMVGKKFKYLSELGLITFQHIAIKDAIDRLHDHIGKLNDYSEITNLENWKKHFNASEISSDLKKHQRKCREVIFFFHLIANSEIIGNQTTGTQV